MTDTNIYFLLLNWDFYKTVKKKDSETDRGREADRSLSGVIFSIIKTSGY